MDKFNVMIQNSFPVITEFNKQRGFVPRYFVSKANQIKTSVFEVDQRQYDNLIYNPYIVGGFVNWKIKGTLEDYTVRVYTGLPPDGMENIIIPGVLTQNESSIIFLSKRIPILLNSITNYSQFHIGE